MGNGLVGDIEQPLVIDRLFNVVKSAVFHRLDGGFCFTVPGDKDNRKFDASVDEFMLKLDAAHTGHANIKEQASKPIGIVIKIVEKLLSGAKGLRFEPDRVHQGLQ